MSANANGNEISITQGLAELKLLDKRIKNLVGSSGTSDWDSSQTCFRFMDVSTKTQQVDAERLKKEAQSAYQSFNDLLKRRDQIKRAINQKNATTIVRIGSWEGTVAEAIEQKASITYKRTLLYSMKKQSTEVTDRLKSEQKDMSDRLDRLLSSEMGKDMRTNPETVSALSASFQENNKITLIDPLDSGKVIKALEEEIESFTTNVDWVLSEANSKTLIRVGSVVTTGII
jgi:hypothetical protein